MVKLVALRGPLVMAAICGIPILLWLRAAPVEPRFSTSTLALTSTAVLCAFAGTAAFAINLVLGARIRYVEWLFGGLDRMYRVHRQNGQVAFALLAMHAFLIFAGRVTVSVSSGFDLVTPRAGRVVFAGFVAITVMGIALVLTLFVRLGQEVFVYVQRTFGFVFLLATYHVFATRRREGAVSDPEVVHGRPRHGRDRGVRLPLAAAQRARAPYALHRRGREPARRLRDRDRARAALEAARLQAGAVRVRQLPLAGAARAPARGRHLAAAAGALDPRRRDQQPVPSVLDHVRARRADPSIAVKAIGDYTNALRRLDEGAEAIVEGPFGSFSNVGLSQPRQIWAAGGIGVTPFLSMARSLGDGGPAVHFYYAVERLEEAHFLDEFRAIEARHDGFEVTVVPREPDGFLTADRLAAENPELGSSDVLICGPPAMITSLRAQLVAHGLPERQVHAEEFGFAKRGPEAAPPPVELPELREPLPPASRLPGRALRARVRRVRLRGRRARRAEPLVGRRGCAGRDGRHSPAAVAAGKAVYASAACGGCHVLEAAGSEGKIGPSLDDAKPSAGRVIDVVTNGKGVMPAYRDKLTPGRSSSWPRSSRRPPRPNAAAASS